MTAQKKTKLAIIADDFTGSNDTGVQFSKKGFSTGLIVYPAVRQTAFGDYDILAIDTESRADTAETASRKVFDAARTLITNGIPRIYKKLDSTMRGNIGAELEAALKGFGASAIVAAPAYPANGRITREGICKVYGVPLAETEFAAGAVTPVTSSFIPDIISDQTALTTGLLGLAAIRAGADAVADELRAMIGHGIAVIVADAETDSDLAATAAALPMLETAVISAGSSAFAAHIADSIGISAEIPNPKPILVVAGSVTETTRAQLEYALKKGYLRQIDIDMHTVLAGNCEAEIDRITGAFSAPGAITGHLLVRTAPSAGDVAEAYRIGGLHGLDTAGTERRIASFLGELTCELYGACGFQGLILAGGDTAYGAAHALGATETVIREEVLPGIPKCTFRGTVHGDIPVITKSGGFGYVDAVARMVEYLERTL